MFEVALFLYLVQVPDPGPACPPVNRRSEKMEQSSQRFWTDAEESSGSADPGDKKPRTNNLNLPGDSMANERLVRLCIELQCRPRD